MKTVQRLFTHSSSKVRLAASYMLGGVVIGNPTHFIDQLFALLGDDKIQEKAQYLNAVRMIIIANPDCLLGNIAELCELFISHAGNENKDIRATTAECIGKMFPLAP